MRIRSLPVKAAAIIFAIFGCSGGTEPSVPSSVAAGSTTPSATAGLVLATAPTFSVKDANGKILGGVPVTVTVTAGGGTLANAATSTTSDSPTSIGTWTLGRVAGVNSVTVTVGSLAPLVITVTGVAGPPAAVAIVSGNSQTALAGTDLANPVTAQVRDQFGNGIAGSIVTFLVTAGGGVINPSTITTDQFGNANGAIWRLGKSDVPQTASANSAGFSTIASAIVTTAYNAEVRFFGPTPSPEAMGAFTAAAARIRAMVVGDVPDIDFTNSGGGAGQDLSGCGIPGVILHEIVDDVFIYATVVSIDGPGKILASAGPCFLRVGAGGAPGTQHPVIGRMTFDADDIAGLVTSGRLNDVVLHEMMHVLGFGTIWTRQARIGGVLLTGGGTDNPRYIGPLATAACAGAGGTGTACSSGVAVEGLPFGAGTADAHWREAIFDSEVMTGFVEPVGVATPLSAMTIQSFADEAYIVNAAVADPYIVPAPLASRQTRSSVSLGGQAEAWETVLKPVYEVTRTGQVRKLITQ
jgi:hypothetical protein